MPSSDPSSKPMPVIRIRDLDTRFGTQLVHHGLALDVHPGEIIGVVGGSGTGKSVLLRQIVGLLRPSAGRIEVLGTDIWYSAAHLRRKVLQRVGLLFQDGALFSSLTVQENVMAPMRENLDLGVAAMQGLANLKIRLAGLPLSAGDKYPSELSGGMRKRAGLARALALDPEILFLDEPTAGLDPIGAAEFDKLIVSLKRELGLTVYMVTHDLDSLLTTCDRIAALIDKKITCAPVSEHLQSDHPWLRAYFHGERARMIPNKDDQSARIE
ncbi:MAG: ABC transporter ATP-binding protein [Pseudomonadota bacterium]